MDTSASANNGGATICCSHCMVPVVPIQYTVTNPKWLPFHHFDSDQPQNLTDSPLAVVHNPTKFRENH